MRESVLTLLLSGCACAAHAHHGFAVHYDAADQVRIEGTVHEVKMRNPHSEISVLVTNDDGDEQIWICETQASSILARKGITGDSFPVGGRIVIEGSRARRQAHGCEIGTAYLADGTSVTMRSARGRADISVNASSGRQATSVFGLWVRDSFSGVPVRADVLDNVTDAGRAANAGYGPARDDPTRQCRPVNPVRAWAAPGQPTDIRRAGERVFIQHEFMDTTRIVHMDADAQPEDRMRTEMGHSIGRVEHGVLIVETSNFDAGVMLTQLKNSGLMHSRSLTLTEVFSVVPETGQLRYQWKAEDPEYWLEPVSSELLLSPTTLEIGTFDCQAMKSD